MLTIYSMEIVATFWAILLNKHAAIDYLSEYCISIEKPEMFQLATQHPTCWPDMETAT